jgi:Zn-dependent peptidase ImmA (M78 family)
MTNKTLEDEANIFACLILMPKVSIAKDLESGVNLEDDTWIKMMCKKYDVPMTALVFRLNLFIKKGI